MSKAGATQPTRHSVLTGIREYFLSLGLRQSQALTEHATHMHHEDVPHHVVTAPEAVINTVTRLPTPPIHSGSPDRLYPLFPPLNYGTVERKAIYRSSYPQVENFEFLKSLRLKTILTLVDVPVSPEYAKFIEENGIQHFRVHIQANKGAVKVQACQMAKAIRIVLDRSNHPLLIHCNKGKHRTGCVVGITRRIQGYDETQIWNEYHVYAEDKARILDENCMDQFDFNTVLWMARKYDWISPDAEV
ncbi:hypothetical protein K504DRAFT_379312 [Pleomassaria siparia CBS 279.74]|uniref:diphosphoinositol-polyphosphate diphosphatase n=1 Tax=Pleomassaria siparia CBS 279.74 TaxID=1314801 RepID=A0A6G1KA21_9PLEO|nr:hypothetical protein K504DRAFT_379312 [Pleomassaria siparia CBS 279.74]